MSSHPNQSKSSLFEEFTSQVPLEGLSQSFGCLVINVKRHVFPPISLKTDEACDSRVVFRMKYLPNELSWLCTFGFWGVVAKQVFGRTVEIELPVERVQYERDEAVVKRSIRFGVAWMIGFVVTVAVSIIAFAKIENESLAMLFVYPVVACPMLSVACFVYASFRQRRLFTSASFFDGENAVISGVNAIYLARLPEWTPGSLE